MTAQVGILNKYAVALATDSAVTVKGGQKIYQSEDKLFSLDPDTPVAFMLNGRTLFLEIPWSIVIHLYKKNLGTKRFDTIKEYATSFSDFLQNINQTFHDEETQNRFLNYKVSEYIKALTKRLTDSKDNDVTLKLLHKDWDTGDSLEYADEEFKSKLIEAIKPIIKKEIDSGILKPFNINEIQHNSLQDLVVKVLTKKAFWGSVSQIVVAGFGEKDIFPGIISINIDDVILGKVRSATASEYYINKNSSARIIPFAQSDVVYSFIEGIDPKLQKTSKKYLNLIITNFKQALEEQLATLSIDATLKEKIKIDLNTKLNGMMEEYFKDMVAEQNKLNVYPLLDSVVYLPKDELAEMAKTLVNLTVVKRRFLMTETESVGGPIDVALLSKTEGFLWVKKKTHYDKL